MLKRLFALGALVLVLGAASPPEVGMVRGTVTDATSGAPVADASVIVRGTTFGTLTNVAGRYLLTGLPAGTYTIEVSRIGYASSTQEVTVTDGATATLDFRLEESIVALEGLTVASGSRRTEKITDAPATIAVIQAREIEEFPAFNIGELAARQKGVDYVRSGVVGTGFNIRGFNSAFNPKNLQVNDGRISNLIATGLPFGNLSTIVKEDIERVEIVLGPTAALYGPNAHNGLVNTITKDPRTSEETVFVLGAGNQSVRSGRLRHAQVINDKVAFKVTGEFTQGTEFDYVDTVYVGSGATAAPFEEIGLNPDFETMRGEAALYITPKEGQDLILSYGGSNSTNLGPTNAGRNQITDWRIHTFQARYVTPRLFAQAYYTMSRTDETFALNQRTQNYTSFIAAGFSEEEALRRSFAEQWFGPMNGGVSLDRGSVFEDNSDRMNLELQYNNTFGPVSLTVGGQYQRDWAGSNGTYLIDDGGQIEIDQLGGYAQLEAPLGESGFRFVLAARGDDHSIEGFNFVPKGGLLYGGDEGTWRVTYGRGVVVPTALNTSANLFGGLILGNGEGFTLDNGTEIEALESETIETWEVGYKGVLGGSLFVDANAYYNNSANFISPLTNISAASPVTLRGNTPITDFQSGAFVLTYLNFGEVQTYGADFGLSYFLNRSTSIDVNYSYFDFSLDENDPANDGDGNGMVTETDLPLNTPTHKGSVAINTSREKWYGSVFARWLQEFNFYSGINVASADNPDITIGGDPVVEGQRVGRDFNEGPLGGFVNFDVSAGVHLSPTLTLGAHISNIFDSEVREFIASPSIGRLIGVELKVRLP